MANLLDKFNSYVVGSNSTTADYIPIIAPSGDFKKLYGINAIFASWKNILMTQQGTYIFDPQYGSNILKLLFDPCDDETINRIKNEIYRCLSTYDDRATITDIDIYYLNGRKGFEINITCEYNGEEEVLQTVIDETTYNSMLRTA